VLDVTGSASRRIAGFGVSGVKPSGFAMRMSDILRYEVSKLHTMIPFVRIVCVHYL
jgi:hypothetical protein